MQAILGEGCTIGKRPEFKVLKTTPLHPASNDLATISALLDTGDEETRLTRFTRVALGPGDFVDAIAIGLIRDEGSSLDVLGFTDLVEAL